MFSDVLLLDTIPKKRTDWHEVARAIKNNPPPDYIEAVGLEVTFIYPARKSDKKWLDKYEIIPYNIGLSECILLDIMTKALEPYNYIYCHKSATKVIGKRPRIEYSIMEMPVNYWETT